MPVIKLHESVMSTIMRADPVDEAVVRVPMTDAMNRDLLSSVG